MKICCACMAEHHSSLITCPECGATPTRVDGFEAHAPELARGGAGFDGASFARLAQLEAANFWFRSRNRLIRWAVRSSAPRMATMLEVGCGTGFVLSGIAEEFPGVELSGSEILADGLALAADRLPGARLMQMDARSVPFRDEFDVVGAFDVLEHIAEDDLALSELYKALKPGGTLIVAVPQHSWLWGPGDVFSHHERRYAARELVTKVTNAGFHVLRSTSFVTILLPLMMVSRWKQRRSKNYDPSAELQVNPVLNWMLERLLGLERLGIQSGLNYPVGGSRLLVARKPIREVVSA
jgi:SAM-dependent methyltransferase